MTRKHTPGPWYYTRDAWTDEHPYSVARGSQIICDVSVFTGCDEANARLIAAAPELLDALENLVRAVEFTPLSVQGLTACATARAAISKAKGAQT